MLEAFPNRIRKAPISQLVFQDNLGKPAPDRFKPIWILTKQEAMGWQWHQLDHMQSFAPHSRHNHASMSSLSFMQARCSSWCPTMPKHWRQ